MSTPADSWNPAQYERFRSERMQPFFDLVSLVQATPGMRVIDLGCGTGELTALLAERLPEATVEGVDSSAKMLAQSEARASGRVSFRRADIATIADFGAYDLVFSHAALQWVPDNESLMQRLLATLKPGAQVTIQLPQNDNHPSHRLAALVASEAPFRQWLGGYVRRTEALPMERYAELLYDHGLREQQCFEKIYGHELAETGAVVEWVKGTMLSAYLSRLEGVAQEAFVRAYRERLLAELGDLRPYFYAFRRMLVWARKAG